MKTKIDLQDLRDNLSVVIIKYNSNEEVVEYMQKIYAEKNMPIRAVNSIIKGSTPLSGLNRRDLGIWCIYLNEFKKGEIDPNEYFNIGEIEKIKSYYNTKIVNHNIDKIILHNVIKVNNQFLCPFVKYEDIDMFWGNALLSYNPDTQREGGFKKKKLKNTEDFTLIPQLNVNWNSVKEISEMIFKDSFIANLLTWNIRKVSNFNDSSIVYDEEEKTLVINSKDEFGNKVNVDIIDGFHRSLATFDAISRATEINRELKGGFMVSITNLTVREAQSLIRREDKRNPIDKEYLQSFKNDEYNIFVDSLNNAEEESINKMKNKIGNTISEIKVSGKYTTKNILHDSFKLSGLDFNEPFINEMYLEHCIYVFNTILGYFNYNYKNNIEQIKKEMIVYEPNVFSGYVAIAKELFNNKNKKEILMKLLDENRINLNRDSYDWESIDMFKKNPRSYKKIYSFFEKIAKEVI